MKTAKTLLKAFDLKKKNKKSYKKSFWKNNF